MYFKPCIKKNQLFSNISTLFIGAKDHPEDTRGSEKY